MKGKKELRKLYREKRDRLKKSKKDKLDVLILDNLFRVLEKKEFSKIMVYLSFGSEVETDLIIKGLNDKEVYAPRIEGKDIIPVKLSKDLNINNYGIREPIGEEKGIIDVSVTPFLIADKRGNRIGYGGGYYDRFFKKNDCLKIGIGYDFQVVESLKEEEYDVPLDIIVTEKGIIICKEK